MSLALASANSHQIVEMHIPVLADSVDATHPLFEGYQ
jgi:hypothetical protein